MPVRKTESRLPAGFTAADLGQAVSSGTNHLVSFLSAPIVRLRTQTYYVFVTDPAVAPNVASYAWTVTNGGAPTNQTTTTGFLECTPQNLGSLSVSVQLKNAASATLATLTMQQSVVALNAQLEALVDQQDRNIPTAGHPETSREAINDLRMYVDALLPPAQHALFNRMLLSVGYAATLSQRQLQSGAAPIVSATPQMQRNVALERHAELLNTGRHADLFDAASGGIGVCRLRPQLLAMFLDKPGSPPGTPYIPLSELPATGAAQITAMQGTIRTAFNALTENEKIDLFNLLRFPRTNYRMAKLVFEKLKDRYFASSTIPQILGVQAEGRKLVKQYETGPQAQTATFGTTAFASAVLNIMNQQVWTIAALPMATGAPAPAAGGGGAAAAPFGSPEHIPQLTFVAQPRLTDNGFIRYAFLYHETHGLAPVLIQSFEDLITRLSQQATPITRLRLVSHFFFDPTGQRPSNMNMAFFTPANPGGAAGQSPQFTVKEYFKFGISDEEGLAAIAEDFFTRASGHVSDGAQLQINFNAPTPGRASLLSIVLGRLRATQPTLLVPFSLQGANSTPSGALNEFIRYCCDLIYVNNVTLQFADAQNPGTVVAMPPLAVTAVRNVYTAKIAAAAAGAVSATADATAVSNLQSAITGIALSSFPVPNPNFGTFFITLSTELLQNHNTFRTNLAAVRNRFSASSVVDIRGCRIGSDAAFMNAVRAFFGNAGSQPSVTAPEWFQSFPTLGFATHGAESGVDGFFNNGTPPTFTAADVQREYTNWAGRLGIPSHLSFWSRLANDPDPFEFLAFQWKNNIPGLGLPASRLNNFSSLGFAAAVQRLGEIFNITANVPAAASLTSFETAIVPHLAGLKTAADAVAVMTATTPAADMTAANAQIQTAKTGLGQTLPAPPNPLTLAYLSSSIQTLKTFVTGQLNIAAFRTALAGKLAAPTAGMRYLLFIGLPLPVQSGGNENNVGLLMLDGLRDDAVKTWMKGHWSGPAPGASTINALSITWSPPTTIIPNTPATHNDDDLTPLGKVLQTPALTVDHAGHEMAINPTFEYQQHIKSTP